MAVYLISGKLGTGKGKTAARVIKKYLREGRRVATNMDIFLEHLMLPHSRKTLIRIPDKPSVDDFDLIGHGNPDSYDEGRNGCIVLDELGTWLNARTFNDKNRQHVIDWLVHSRKLGWDLYLTCQSFNAVDKQVRESVVEYLIRCVRYDKHRIPFFGHLLGVLNDDWGRLPRFHKSATYMVVEGSVAKHAVDSDYFQGDELHKAYDTRQIFTSSYPHGVHSLLSSWHLSGRHGVRRRRSVIEWCRQFVSPAPKPGGTPKPLLPIVAKLAGLPADERIRHWRRLDAAGVIK